MLFKVHAENDAPHLFNQSRYALAFAEKRVFLDSRKRREVIAALERGERVAWQYGFTSVEITPREDDPPEY